MRNILKSGDISEDAIQMTVMEWVRMRPALARVVLHIPNEGKRSVTYGRKLRSMGMRSGVSDLFIAHAANGFHGAWIELKSARGVLSPMQKAFFEDMRKQGYFTACCYSIEEAIDTITKYCVDR